MSEAEQAKAQELADLCKAIPAGGPGLHQRGSWSASPRPHRNMSRRRSRSSE